MPKVFFNKERIRYGNINDVEDENLNEVSNYINSVMDGKIYGIGLHQTSSTNENNVANRILENGLRLNERETILSTVSSLGINRKVDKYLQKTIIDYSYGRQNKDNKIIVVLVPCVIANSKGEKIFLGFPPADTNCYGNNYRLASVLDILCISETTKGNIPKEFILGYFSNNNGKVDFVKNAKFYTLLTQQEKDNLFISLKQKLKGKYKQISDAVISQDVEMLEELSEIEQSTIKTAIKQETKNNVLNRGMSAELAKITAQKSVQISQDETATQALNYLNILLEEKKWKEEISISL